MNIDNLLVQLEFILAVSGNYRKNISTSKTKVTLTIFLFLGPL